MRPPGYIKLERSGFTLELFVREVENLPGMIRVPFHLNKKVYEVVARLSRGKIVYFEVHYVVTIRKSYMYEPEFRVIPGNPVLFVRGLLEKYMKGYDFEFFYQHFSYYVRAFTYYGGLETDVRDLGFVRVRKGKYSYDLYDWGRFVGELSFTVRREDYVIIDVFWNGEKYDSIVVSDFERMEFFIARKPAIRVAIESYRESGSVDEESFIEYLSAKYARLIEKDVQPERGTYVAE